MMMDANETLDMICAHVENLRANATREEYESFLRDMAEQLDLWRVFAAEDHERSRPRA